MKHYILSAIVLFFTITCFAQQKAERVYSITKIQKDYTYYNQQAILWQEQVKITPKNAMTWLNYFTAARMNNMFAGKDGSTYDLNLIAEDIQKNIPDSFEAHYVAYKLEYDPIKAHAHLVKAYKTDPTRYETWDAFISKAEFERDTKTMKQFLEKWYAHELYSPGITTWNYNVLAGLDQNAVLLTFGDNDTYPLWFLQTVKNIRTDIKIINTSLVTRPSYQKLVFNELNIPALEKTLEQAGSFEVYREAIMEHIITHTNKPVYMGISAPRSFTTKHEKNLYVIGLAYKYSTDDFDHVAVLRKNFETLYLKDYIKYNLTNDFSQSVVNHMNQQYLPALTILYKHYMLSEELSKANEIEELMLAIGNANQTLADINNFLMKFKKS